MKKMKILLLFLALITTNLYSQNSYKELWHDADSLLDNGLPKSAKKYIDKIYIKAKYDNNTNQFIRVLFYKLQVLNATNEDYFPDLIKELEKEYAEARMPAKNLIATITAEAYWNYYNRNRWKINQRTTALIKENDIRSWDAKKLTNKSIDYYFLSIKNADLLQKENISKYKSILIKGTLPSNIRPSLFDFLIFRAINFLENTNININNNANKFKIDNEKYFLPTEKFANLDLTIDSSLISSNYYLIKLYQQLIKAKLKNSKKSKEALIDAELKRLDFIYSKSTIAKKNEKYLLALENLLEKYNKIAYSSMINYKIASFYYSESSKYNYRNLEKTAKYKNYKVKAKKICKETIAKYPNSRGTNKCKELETIIEKAKVKFQVENIISTNTNFPVKIEYKNIKNIYCKLAFIEEKTYEKIYKKHYGGRYNSGRDKKFYNEINQAAKTIKNSKIETPVSNDLNQHSLEYISNKLTKKGRYFLVLSAKENLEYSENLIAYNFFKVSNIAYLKRKYKNEYQVFVLDRKTGQAKKNAKVKFYHRSYNYGKRKYVKTLIDSKLTDETGFVKTQIKENFNNGNISFDITLPDGDFINSAGEYVYHNRKEKVKKEQKTYIYTDRAIYRPGQTVHFKIYRIEYDPTTNTNKIIPNYKTKIILYDVNSQKVAEIDAITNEWGTFSSSFQLPMGILNGRFSIRDNYKIKYIRVEEYKRPTFIVEIDEIKEEFVLNDMVEISGNAKNYSGAKLSGAKVKYRITREPRWRWWGSWNNQSPTEIANGEVITKNDGSFTVKFKAIPDYSYTPNENDYYSFKINIDITDINGETQSKTKNINIGYKSLKLSADIDEIIFKNEKKNLEFNIKATNLNSQEVDAKGEITIYRFFETKKTHKERLWEKPESQNSSIEEWNEKLPLLEFKNECEYSKEDKK